jgi:3-deoxy-D-manno-octulosonic-acid transferase
LLLFYNLFIRLYYVGIRLASLWNGKARKWLTGRKNLAEELSQKLDKGGQYIWMHCSSAGEFEQGKPIAEAIKNQYPNYKLLVSFFSPSGYEAAKNYGTTDVTCYLPLDTKKNAMRFLNVVNPELALFIKYEFWYHHLSAAAANQVPLLLASATFRKEQVFFKPYGGFFRKMLHRFKHIFVQDNASVEILQAHKIYACSKSGDTRFDRVKTIGNSNDAVPLIEDFLQSKKAVVAGSTWDEDEVILRDFAVAYPAVKLVIAPHEIDKAHLQRLQFLFPNAVLYSSMREKKVIEPQVLIVDSVGLLSRLYRYATITYVGGGFTKDGIHNILEAAVWGRPVIFGPNYKKYREAIELLEAGGGFSIKDAGELKKIAVDLLNDEQYLQAVSRKAKSYVEENTGATEKIIQFIQENRLLTR